MTHPQPNPPEKVESLLPCPFCARIPNPEYCFTASQGLIGVFCVCDASGPMNADKGEAIDGWNRRADPQAARILAREAQVAGMGEALDFYGQADLYTVIDRETALGHDDGNLARKARLAAAKEPS